MGPERSEEGTGGGMRAVKQTDNEGGDLGDARGNTG